jgi:CRISPR/Cas system endoribonuclease Cas6 (RAMP superfamily)
VGSVTTQGDENEEKNNLPTRVIFKIRDDKTAKAKKLTNVQVRLFFTFILIYLHDIILLNNFNNTTFCWMSCNLNSAHL